ncbi:YitT family protein [Mobilitalea sibirica]|uniref:YitT family protein n=1 Tax=Mobilitalea sibirica TaxID=1462919 RepID=A0A8J7H6K9_9FIRM|nr:YitT family protein [Mobilitalea sibirica]MBH1942569.1 YitT family protein [Mobilitalea sibirica]
MSRKKITNKNILFLRRFLTIIIGAILMALSVNLVYEPMGLVTGGVSGLAIVIKKITEPIIEGGLPIWLFTVLCNVPLFFFTVKLKGKKFIISVFFGTITYILALMIIPIVDYRFEDALLASIIGGTIGGAGIGMVFSAFSSTGGTDLLATLVHDYKKHVSVPQILIVIDGVIIFIGALVFGLGNALYAIIAVFITAKVSDGILEGLKFAKMAYIISDEHTSIADAIMRSLDRGVTGISATGMYSNKDRKMLFCVVSKKEIVKIIEISKKIDPNCFVIVSDVREALGEGFIEYRQ